MAVALVAALLLGHQLWAGVALVYLAWRLTTWRCPRGRRWVGLLALAMVGRCLLHQTVIQQRTLPAARTGTYQVVVQPDAWQVNGQLALATGRLGKEPVRVSLQLTTPAQVKQIKQLTTPVVATITGQKGPLLPATNVNQFDYQKYENAQGVANQVRGRGVLTPLAPASPLAVVHGWRARLTHRLARFPQPLASYCQRLLLGQNDPALGPTITAAQTLGVIHLFCLSGLHAFVFVALLRGGLLALHVTRETTTWLEIIALPLLWVLGGGATSLTRAILMLEFQLLARQAGCSSRVSWQVSLILHSLLQPGVLLSLGGQLSYLLAWGISRCQFQAAWRRLVAIQLIGLPPLLYAAYQFHFLSLLANWLLVPLFASVVLPGLLVIALLGPGFSGVVSLANAGLQRLQAVLTGLAALPGNCYFGKPAAVVAGGLLLATLLLIEEEARFRRRWPWLLGAYLLCFVVIHCPLSGEVTFVDIGQGDCALIRTPLNRQVIMIDTGGQLQFRSPGWAKRQPAQRDRALTTSVNYLKSQGIHRLDYLCLSHRDADHIGYLTTVVQQLQVKAILVPQGMEKLPELTRRLPATIPVVPVTDHSQPAGLRLTVLHPFGSGQGKNEDSMVLWGKFGAQRFLFTGDLDRAGERAVLHRYPQLQVEVLKLGHHGSQTASDPTVLRRLRPQLAIISAGRKNRYGHPHQSTIQTLKRQQIPFWSTQQRGMITYRYWGNHGTWMTKLKGSELTWMLPPYARN